MLIKNVKISDDSVIVTKENGDTETFNETTLKLLLNGFTNFVQVAMEEPL